MLSKIKIVQRDSYKLVFNNRDYYKQNKVKFCTNKEL